MKATWTLDDQSWIAKFWPFPIELHVWPDNDAQGKYWASVELKCLHGYIPVGNKLFDSADAAKAAAEAYLERWVSQFEALFKDVVSS